MAKKAKALNTVLALAVAGVGVGGYFLLRNNAPSATTTRSVNAVQRGSVQASVTASGNLAAKQQSDMTFDSAVSSALVQQILVKVGDKVTSGQTLAMVDPTNVQATFAKASADLRTSEVALSKAQAAITEAARATADQLLADAHAYLDATREDYTVALAASPDDAALLASLASVLATAETNYHTVAASTAIASSNAIATAEASYASSRLTFTTAQRNLTNTTLQATFDGTVTALNGVVGRPGSFTGGTGGNGAAASATPFIQVADLGGFEVKAGFSETDAAKLQAGQTATVSIDSLGARITARVRQVDAVSTLVNNVVTYYAYMAIDQPPPNATLRPGQTANVSVASQRVENVLFLPSSALTARGQTTSVQVAPDKAVPTKTVTKEITLGLKGDTTVEVTAGLNEGDVVVTSRSRVSSGTGTATGQTGTAGFPGAGAGGAGAGGAGAGGFGGQGGGAGVTPRG